MKIMHITESMASGVLRYLQEAVRVNESDRHYIVYSKRIYTPNDLNKLFPDSIQLFNIDFQIRPRIKSIKTLYEYIRDINPDVIHLHSTIAGIFGRLIITVCFPKKRVLYTPHGYSFLMTDKSKLIRAVFWLVEFAASQLKGNIVACSKSEYRYAKKLSPFRKVFLLENCINIIPTQKENHRPLSNNKQIIGVGRMENQKNPKLFIEIIAELRKIDPDIKAVWIGDGPLRAECEDLNRSLGANVKFTGWLSNQETIQYLENSSIFLQTSKWEGLPYSVLEAFAVGLPVVASDIESHRDFIGSRYLGFIAENIEQYIEYISELLNNIELANKISEFNKKRLEKNFFQFSQKLRYIYSNECMYLD